MEQKKRKSLTSEANRILIDDIAPLITKMFSSITSELIVQPQHWKDEDGTNKQIYDAVSDKAIEFIESYVKGTAELQYSALCKPPFNGTGFLKSP